MIKNKKYYRDANERIGRDIKRVDHYANMAEFYKKVYFRTKDIPRLSMIAEVAKRGNSRCVSKGISIGMADLYKCVEIMEELSDRGE